MIQNPKLHSKGRFLHYGQWVGERPPSAQQRVRLAIVEALGKQPADFAAFLRLMEESGFAVKHGRGGVISFLAPGQDKPTRLRSSTLGLGFDPEDIRAVIAGGARSRSCQGGPPRPGASISSSTFKTVWPRAKARPMNGGRRSTTSNRWPPRSCISGSMG
ncbi:MAG: hypothetical protein ACLTFS_20585 [Flavonifractor plautii]